MIHEWLPDTCQCVMEFSEGGNDATKFKRFTNTCNLHQTSNIGDVITHNQSFNLNFGRAPTKTQIDTISENKQAELDRIKGLRP